MKALIIGGGGFVGRYLAEHLLQDCGWETIVTKLPKEIVEVEGCEAYNLDILDKDAVEALLVRHKPDAILHLAAQSSVAYSWKNPQLTADINIHGCLNVLDAVRDMPDYSPKILLIGSGEEYGILPANTSLVSETTPVHPANPYAITKMAQNLFGALYAKAYEMHVMMVRAFNHVGPRQLPQYVVSDFCKQVAEIMAGKPAVIRTVDLGADRQAEYMGIPDETNPMMGNRGIRLCLDRKKMFKAQLRAIYRASAYGNLSLMYPMITSENELDEIEALIQEVKEGLREKNIPFKDVRTGIMIETPAAVMISEELGKRVDFLSLGTNDLTQYTLAMDRQNLLLKNKYADHHPAILKMIRMVIEGGHRSGCKVYICGELAADSALTEKFIQIGVDGLSVVPACVLPIRKALRNAWADPANKK